MSILFDEAVPDPISPLARVFIHFVWRTREGCPCIDSAIEALLEELLREKCYELRGVFVAAGFADDHVHVVAQVDPRASIVEFARHLKGFSSRIVSTRYPDFVGWQDGYYAESVNWRALAVVTSYLQKQCAHHPRERFGRVTEDGLTIRKVASIDDLDELDLPKRGS